MSTTTILTPYMPPTGKRIFVISGHYGSGKTEFAVSLAMLLAKDKLPWPRLALIDLDIANPYFRSREKRDMLERSGCRVYGSAYKTEITAELPALGADLRAPLEDEGCFTIIDVGGNDDGAKVLNPFIKYFQKGEHLMLTVINKNRPETGTIDTALAHILSIEKATGIPVDGLVNNCHLLRETTAETVNEGLRFCLELSEKSGKPLWCSTYPSALVDPADIDGAAEPLVPLGMYMRESWLDK